MTSPQQELFTALLVQLRQAYPDQVFDGDLPQEAPYPFIYIGDTQQIADQRVKGAVFGRVTVQIHVWHNDERKRGDLSLLLFNIQQIARSISYTDSYGWCLSGADEMILPDNSTADPLVHGVLSLEFKHYWR